MPHTPRRSLSAILRATIRNTQPAHPPTEPLQVLTEQQLVHTLDLAMRLGDALLSVGASAHDVTLTVKKVTHHYGLSKVQVNVTYDSITVSYHRGSDGWPATLMRVVIPGATDYSKLQALLDLEAEIYAGLGLEEARSELRQIRAVPFPYRPFGVMVSQALLAAGVSVMFGAGPIIILLSFLAGLAAAWTQHALTKTGMPLFFKQVFGGFVVASVAATVSALGRMGVPLLTEARPSLIVVSGIMMMLAGMLVVGAMQDAINGYALTAGSRILDLTMRTLGVVIGIVIGLVLAQAIGQGIVLHAHAPAFGQLWQQMLGAVIVSIAVAFMNGSSMNTIIVSGVLSVFTMIGFRLAHLTTVGDISASGIGALLASFVGGFVAHRLRLPATAVTTAAIIPLVPGGTVFMGLLSLVQSEGPGEGLVHAGTSLMQAGMTGIALAAGATFGLFLSTPVRSTIDRVARTRIARRR